MSQAIEHIANTATNAASIAATSPSPLTNLNDTEIAAIGWFVTILLALVGWIYNSSRQRKLQRKQLAITLLNENRFEQAWVDSLSAVFKIVFNDRRYDWKSLATKRYSHDQKLDDDEDDLHLHLRTVLNYLEFIAVAVLNKAVDEDVIKWSLEGYYEYLAKAMKDYIKEARDLTRDQDIYINFDKLVDRWKKTPDHAKPSKRFTYFRR